MRFYRDLIIPTFLSIVIGLTSGCKTKEEYNVPFFPVPIGAYIDADGVQTEVGERQSELEQIIHDYDIKHIADIIYYDEINRGRYYQVMEATYDVSRRSADKPWNKIGKNKGKYGAITVMPQSKVGTGKPSLMIVPSNVFEKYKNRQDLISFIVDHEGMHAKDNATGLIFNGKKVEIDEVGEKLYVDIMELRAYNNQLLQIEKGRAVSEECKDLIAKAYGHYHQRMLIMALNGNKYARAAICEALYTPVIDLDHKKLIFIRKGEFLKGSEFEKCKGHNHSKALNKSK